MRINRNELSILCLFSLGLAFLKVWEEVFFFKSLITYDVGFSSHQVYFVGKAATLLIGALFSRQVSCLFAKPSFSLLGIATLFLSTVCLSFAVLQGESSLPVVIIGDISGAIAFTLFFAVWFSQCRWFSPLLILGSYMISSLVVALIVSFCSRLPLVGILIATGVFAVAAAGLTVVAYRLMLRTIDPGNIREAERRKESFPGMLWRLIVVIGAQRFVFAFNEASLSIEVFSTGSYSSVGYLVVSIGVIFCVMLSWRKATLIMLVRYVMPILGIVFLVLPRNSAVTAMASGVFASGFCAAIDFTVILLLAMMCHCTKSSREWLRMFGLVFGMAYLCVAAGETTFLLLPSSEMFKSAFGVVATLAAIALVVALPDSSLIATWFSALQTFDHSESDANDLKTAKAEAAVDYHTLARQYGLTLREEEIFGLIAEGKTGEEISEQLVISSETVRTHRRHIYEKIGVHTEEEFTGFGL